MSENVYKSKKSKSEFIARGDTSRAYLVVTGEAGTKAKVQKEIERIRREGSDFMTVDYIARMMASTY